MESKIGLANVLSTPWPTPKLHRLLSNILSIRERRQQGKSAAACLSESSIVPEREGSSSQSLAVGTFAFQGKQPQSVSLEALTAEFRALSLDQLREQDATKTKKALKGLSPMAPSTSLSAPTATVIASDLTTSDILTLPELSSDAPRTSSQVFNAVWNAVEHQATLKKRKSKPADEEALSDNAPTGDRPDEESAALSTPKGKSRIFHEYMNAMTKKVSLGEKETLNEIEMFRVPASPAWGTGCDEEQELPRVTKPATKVSWAVLASKQSSAGKTKAVYNEKSTPLDAQLGGPHPPQSVSLTQPVQGFSLNRPLQQGVPSDNPLTSPLQSVPLSYPVQGVPDPVTQPIQGVPLISRSSLLLPRPVPAHLEHQSPVGKPLLRPAVPARHDPHHLVGQPLLRSQAFPAHLEHQHPVGQPLLRPQAVPARHDPHHLVGQRLLRLQAVPAHLEHQHLVGQPLLRSQTVPGHLEHQHLVGEPLPRSQPVPAHLEHQHQKLQQRQTIVQPLSWASASLSSPFAMDKQEIGESLYPLVSELCPTQAGKVTGMLLELGQKELLELMQSPQNLKAKVEEALAILRAYQQKHASSIQQDGIGPVGNSAAERNSGVVEAGQLEKPTPADAALSSPAGRTADRLTTTWPTAAARPLAAPEVVDISSSPVAVSRFEEVENDEPVHDLKAAASDFKVCASVSPKEDNTNARVAQEVPSRSAAMPAQSREVISSPISWSSLNVPDDFPTQSRDEKSSPRKGSIDSLWDLEELLSRELDGEEENVHGRLPSSTAEEPTDPSVNLAKAAEDLSRQVEQLEALALKDEALSQKSHKQVLGSLLLPLVQRLVADPAWAININAVLLQRLDLSQLQQMLHSQDILVARIHEAYALLQNQQAAYLQQQLAKQLEMHQQQLLKQQQQQQQQQQQIWQWYQQLQLRPDPNVQLTQRLHELQLAAQLDRQRQLQQLQAYHQLQLTQQYLLHQQAQEQAGLSGESDHSSMASPRSASSAHLEDKELGTAEHQLPPAKQKLATALEIPAASETAGMREEGARELDQSSRSQKQDLLEGTLLSQHLQTQVGQPLYYRPSLPDHPLQQPVQLEQQQQPRQEEQKRLQYQHMMVMKAAAQFFQQQDYGAETPDARGVVDRRRTEGPGTNIEALTKEKASSKVEAWRCSRPGSTESGADSDDYQAPEEEQRRSKLADSVSPTDRLLDSFRLGRFDETGWPVQDEQKTQTERTDRIQEGSENCGAFSPQEINSSSFGQLAAQLYHSQLQPHNAHTAVEQELLSGRVREDPDRVPDPEILRRLLQQSQKEAELAQRQLQIAQQNMMALWKLQQAQLDVTAQGLDPAASVGFESANPAPYPAD